MNTCKKNEEPHPNPLLAKERVLKAGEVMQKL
jgi:hypothetical protein